MFREDKGEYRLVRKNNIIISYEFFLEKKEKEITNFLEKKGYIVIAYNKKQEYGDYHAIVTYINHLFIKKMDYSKMMKYL